MDDIFEKYSDYIKNHREYVKKAFNVLLPKLIDYKIVDNNSVGQLSDNIEKHDLSKYQMDEFLPYANYFYGEKSAKNISDFKFAEKLHKSRNPHHPEYWMNEDDETFDMPTVYIIEMICDWWAMGLSKNNPNEIFGFYSRNKDKYKFSDEIVGTINQLLSIILEYNSENEQTIADM